MTDVEELLLEEIRSCRARIEDVSDNLVEHMAREEEHAETTNERLGGCEDRLSNLETLKARALLSAASIGGIASVAFELLK